MYKLSYRVFGVIFMGIIGAVYLANEWYNESDNYDVDTDAEDTDAEDTDSQDSDNSVTLALEEFPNGIKIMSWSIYQDTKSKNLVFSKDGNAIRELF